MSGELVVLAVFLAWWAGAATGAVILHAYLTRDEPEPCDVTLTGIGFSAGCSLKRGHRMPHRDENGTTWRPVS